MTQPTPLDAAAPAGVRDEGRCAKLLPRLALVVVLLGALLIRIDFTYNAYYFKNDHGTAALVSWHILRGDEFPLYSYGSFKVGTLGNFVGAATFALFGVSPESLCLAMVLFTLLWVFATYLLFGRLVGRWAGVIAAALVAFAPFTVMWYSVVPMVFYPPTFALGTLVLYFGVRLNDRDLTEGSEWGCVLAMAAVAGLVFWTNALSAMYLLVGLALLAVHVVRSRFRRALLVKLGAGLLVLVVALLPVLLTLVQHGTEAVYGYRQPDRALIGSNLEMVLGFYVQDMLLRGVHENGVVWWLLTAAYAVPAVVFAAGFVVGIVLAIVTGERRLLRPTLVPVLFVLSAALLFLPSPMAATKAPRYFVPFYLVVSAMFAFPLVLRRAWITWATAALALVAIGGNIAANIEAGHGEGAGLGKRHMADLRALVANVEAADLRHVMIDTVEGQALTFLARERVVFAQTARERCYPYAVAAAADDAAAIAPDVGAIASFRETLASLGVEAPEPILGAGVAVFHGFVLPDDGLRVVAPESVVAFDPAVLSGQAAWLIDGDEGTSVGGRYEDKQTLVVDFGRTVPLSAVRFVLRRESECPAGYVLSGLPDGADWRARGGWSEIQRVESRVGPAYISGARLYYRGDFTPMECRFAPSPIRYLKISGLRGPGGRAAAWRFHEAYFYTSVPGVGHPDEAEAAAIARELTARGADYALCDEWLSRKIEALPGPRPDVLPHYEWQHPDSHVSRVLPVRDGVAVVVETGHAEQCRDLLRRATFEEVAVEPVEFPHYTALVIAQVPAPWRDFPGLTWNGLTLVRTASMATAACYERRGESLERAGRRDEAMGYYRRAFETFPGIPANLEKLAPLDEEARAALEALTPAHETPCRFTPSIALVGYSIEPAPLVAGRNATLRLVWELEGRLPADHVPVFVHFVEAADATTIRFQGDHTARFPTLGAADVPRCRVLDEHTVVVPADCPAGEMLIRLGALDWRNDKKRLRPTTDLPVDHRAVEIGRVEVVGP